MDFKLNEADTRAQLIDTALRNSRWIHGTNTVQVRREQTIKPGQIRGKHQKPKTLIADYLLYYRGKMMAVIEAKAFDRPLSEGVRQAKEYSEALEVRFCYSSNGQGFFGIDMQTGVEKEFALDSFPTPQELWQRYNGHENIWLNRFAEVQYEDKNDSHPLRYYQHLAVERVLEALVSGKERILLTLATGTGKTFIAFQIVWKLFHSHWNLENRDSPNKNRRQPRVLFLADRNMLANQAKNGFSAFNDDSMTRISPADIRKAGKVPKSQHIYFTIFQTFTAGSLKQEAQQDPSDEIELKTIRPISQTPFKGVYQPWHVFVFQGANGRLTLGRSQDVNEFGKSLTLGQIQTHNAISTPYRLVYDEVFETAELAEARHAELQKLTAAALLFAIHNAHKRSEAEGDGDRDGDGDGDGDSGAAIRLDTAAAAQMPSPAELRGYFGEYEPDFFDLIIIDECHRGGANDEGSWRAILDYFKPAVQLGLTATPKRKDNVDTYRYFGDPVYSYSLKQGINDGFLTPFKVVQFTTSLDEYIYTADDDVVEGEIELGRTYAEKDFNRVIEIPQRERYRVKLLMQHINQKQKTLVFCANQAHALQIRDLINQMKASRDTNYCHRVTADDGSAGDQFLRQFQDNERTIPTVLTTSQKLSTGVDARNVRNIVLLRPVNSMIEFKQIIGRGTRLHEDKYYFKIFDFVQAHKHFSDPEWDGEALEVAVVNPDDEPTSPEADDMQAAPEPELTDKLPRPRKHKIKVVLADGKERKLQHMAVTSYWHPDGKPMSAQEFLESLYGTLPELFKDEAKLRELWSQPDTRTQLLHGLKERGFGLEQLHEMRRIVANEDCDLFDVLAYVAYRLAPETRAARAQHAQEYIKQQKFTGEQRQFLDFVLGKYTADGVEQLATQNLKGLIDLRYGSIMDAKTKIGDPTMINQMFTGFQQALYQPLV